MRARHEIREQLYRDGEHDADELQELQLEVLLDIRDLLTAEVYGTKVKPEEVLYGRIKGVRDKNYIQPGATHQETG